MTYVPSKEILEKYADVVVNFALGNDGRGIKKGETVFANIPECAKPMILPLQKSVLKAGGNFILQYSPDGVSKDFFNQASDEQLSFFPDKLLKGRVDQVDHIVFIEAEADKKELEGVDPKKIMMRQKSMKPYMDWRRDKENKGKMAWNIILFGTEAMAKEVGLTLEEYWAQIIKGCYLDDKNPIQKWRDLFKEIAKTREKLNSLKIKSVHIKSKDIDLIVGLGKGRKWLGCSGRNTPSFELFISPDWRGTNGKIKCNMPLYRYGNIVKGIELEFKDGKVVKSKAAEGESVIKSMIATENADKIGEFSLTDKRFSRIDKFMGCTLYDENFGGKYGNTHIALGNAYRDSYPGDVTKVTKEEWKELGYNESAIHTDIISTEDRVVTAELEDGKKMVIYKDGMFCI